MSFGQNTRSGDSTAKAWRSGSYWICTCLGSDGTD